MISALLISIPVLIVISLVVFGGGQIFMPLFQIYWNFLAKVMHIEISQTTIDSIFGVSNATPGVLSTKFAFISGFLISNNQWYGFFVAVLTYLTFILPAMLVMYLAICLSKKYKNNSYGEAINKLMKPVVGGIMIALVVQLFVGSIVPFLNFNGESLLFGGKYISIDWNEKAKFFSGYRLYILIAWVILSFSYSYYLYIKKFPIWALIIINIIIAILIFHPFVN